MSVEVTASLRLARTCPLCFSRSTFFFFNDTATTEIYTLSLHDALPISCERAMALGPATAAHHGQLGRRSEEHTSELQSHVNLVCRLLLEKKKEIVDDQDTDHYSASANKSDTRVPRESAGPRRRLRSRACFAGSRAAVPSEFFFFNDEPTTEIYTLSLHDALPI